jgi:hypothetical protein
MGSGCLSPFIPKLVSRWRWMVSFTLSSLHPRETSTWYTLNKRLGRPQSWSGCFGVKFIVPSGNWVTIPVIQPIA